ncbi:MAG: hypothetical protein HY904_22455 [Deltaproteobacteria bacterium]|nr:hypothetical protein [Deltaproteobacteria bacterium]
MSSKEAFKESFLSKQDALAALDGHVQARVRQALNANTGEAPRPVLSVSVLAHLVGDAIDRGDFLWALAGCCLLIELVCDAGKCAADFTKGLASFLGGVDSRNQGWLAKFFVPLRNGLFHPANAHSNIREMAEWIRDKGKNGAQPRSLQHRRRESTAAPPQQQPRSAHSTFSATSLSSTRSGSSACL